MFTISFVKEMLKLMNDDQDSLLYISGQPAPTYKMVRYTDWFGGYLREHFIDASNNRNYGQYKEKKYKRTKKAIEILYEVNKKIHEHENGKRKAAGVEEVEFV